MMTNIYSNPTLDNPVQVNPANKEPYQEAAAKVPPKAKPVLDRVSVNGVDVPEGAIMSEAQHHPAETPGEALAEAAQALVIRELLLQEARAIGIKGQPVTEDNAKPETSEDALIRQLIDQEINVPQATTAECERYYLNNPQKFSSETIYEASHILLAASPKDKTKRELTRQKAEEICQQLKSDPSLFKGYAQDTSDCPSKDNGGNLGQLTKGSTVEEFEKALEEASEPGLLPAPIASRFGYHIIRLDRKILGKTLPFEHVHKSICNWLEAKSWSKAVSQYVRILAGKAEIEGITISDVETPLVQ